MRRTIAHSFRLVLSLALCVPVLLSSRSGSAEETAVAVAPLPAAARQQEKLLVVLKDGTRIEPQRVTRTPTTLKLQLADGQTRIYRLDNVDLDASTGVPPQTRLTRARPRSNGLARRSSLSAMAGTRSLQVPEANAASDDGITLVSAGASTAATDETQETGETKEPGALVDTIGDNQVPQPLHNAMSAVSSAWQECRSAMDRVSSSCSGNYVGRVGRGCGGGSTVVGAQHTAPCHDAINQALAKLDAVEARYEEAWSVARRTGGTPGSTRKLLSSKGLADTRRRAGELRASIEAIADDHRSEP